jgi:hypothetical protein
MGSSAGRYCRHATVRRTDTEVNPSLRPRGLALEGPSPRRGPLRFQPARRRPEASVSAEALRALARDERRTSADVVGGLSLCPCEAAAVGAGIGAFPPFGLSAYRTIGWPIPSAAAAVRAVILSTDGGCDVVADFRRWLRRSPTIAFAAGCQLVCHRSALTPFRSSSAASISAGGLRFGEMGVPCAIAAALR